MSDEIEVTPKTKTDYLRDVASQLKEMRHYAENNTKTLSSQYLAFEAGEYKDDEFAGRINTLLNEQGKLMEDIDVLIEDLEISVNRSEQES